LPQFVPANLGRLSEALSLVVKALIRLELWRFIVLKQESVELVFLDGTGISMPSFIRAVEK